MPIDDRDDPFAPPAEPCECWCLHCRRTYTSDQIWFQRVIGDQHGLDGFWICPTPNCEGSGFSFDIFPTDPEHPINAGWVDDDQFDDEAPTGVFDDPDREIEYDPAETKWKDLDAQHADYGEEIEEGDEWKLGISPVDRDLAFSTHPDDDHDSVSQQADYNAPDRRPRELDWSNHLDDSTLRDLDDDIPF